MSLYFDYKVQSPDPAGINFHAAWHSQQLYLAVASYSQARGGYVSLFDELGETLQDINDAQHPIVQVTSLQWHPQKKILATGWENGELRVWLGDRNLTSITSPHNAAVMIIEWSSQGGRLVSADVEGCIVGWKVDQQGNFMTVFHLELKAAALNIVFRVNQVRQAAFDMSGLAKAAVNGDESALDMFSAWRPRTAGNRFAFQAGKADNLCFYVGTVTGSIFYITDDGMCTEVINADGNTMPRKILYRETREQLLILNDNLSVAHYNVQLDGNVTEITKIKLTGRGKESTMSWAGTSMVAMTTGDLTVRCWDLDSGENELLETALPPSNSMTEIFTCLAYSPVKGLLCGGTNAGNVVMWRWGDNTGWTLQPSSQLRGSIKQVCWGTSVPLLAVNTVNSVMILKEQFPCAHHNQGITAVQVSPCQLALELASDVTGVRHKLDLKTDQQVTGVTVAQDHAAVWSNKIVVVYHLSTEGTATDPKVNAKVIGSFPCIVEGAAINQTSIVVLEEAGVIIRTFQGAVKQTLSLLAIEGTAMTCELCNNYLAVATTGGYLKLWDMTKREAKQHCPTKDLTTALRDFTEVISAKVNSSGTKVALHVAKSDFIPDSKLFLWDVESDILQHLDFETGLLDSGDLIQESERIRDRFILSHCWDSEEPRLLACEAKLLPKLSKRAKAAKTDPDTPQVIVIGLFTGTERAFMIQDIFPLGDTNARLLGVQTPHYLLLENPGEKKAVDRQVMRDFEGLEDCDVATKKAVTEFSYSMSIGHMDNAFKAIRSVESPVVWTSLARMCVKTHRLDVAYICLGHMKHARGIRALRQAEQEPEVEARVAMLAVQLGMTEEAERLYRTCGRHDLLNRMFQAAGDWEKAVELATSFDRIHLRSTYHAYAEYLEESGQFELAMTMYEKADTHKTQVPRMLADHPEVLESYIMRDKLPDLIKWWGQYMESIGQLEAAIEIYKDSADYLSLVRVLCFQEKLSEAAEIARSTNHKPACYHLARQYEAVGQIQEAVHFYSLAETYGNAVRLCKEQQLDQQLWQLAQLAGRRQQLEAAKYFEQRDQPDKAVILYQRSGNVHKAVDIAFRSEQYDALYSIAGDLTASSDPALVKQCAEFFVADRQFDKAVQLLSLGQQLEDAMTLCEEHHVIMSETLADQLTATKVVGLMERVAELAQQQGNYHLATKKFTQAGNKVKAMKALLKSGDTEKIIFFANVSRQKEIYVMAANYLQSLDWQSQPQVLKTIVAFYIKGKAPELLANFYVACAQLEVDEFQNYEKALGALEEAHRCLNKDQSQHARALDALNERISLVKRFVDIRRQWSRGDRDAAFGQCRQLLQTSTDSLEASVRRGDIYTLMIEHRAEKQDFAAALQLVEEFQKAVVGVDVHRYLGTTLLEKIAKEMNVPVIRRKEMELGREVEGEEEEEVAEEYEEERL